MSPSSVTIYEMAVIVYNWFCQIVTSTTGNYPPENTQLYYIYPPESFGLAFKIHQVLLFCRILAYIWKDPYILDKSNFICAHFILWTFFNGSTTKQKITECD